MSTSRRNSNRQPQPRKSQSLNKLNRVLSIDCLEDRRLMAANLNGSMTDRTYFKAFPAQQAAVVAPAAPTEVSSQPAAAIDSKTPVLACPAVNTIPAAQTTTQPKANVAAGSNSVQPAPVGTKVGPQAEPTTAPTGTSQNPVFTSPTHTAAPSATPAPAAQQSLFGLKTRPVAKPTDNSTYSGEIHLLELQNTDVSATGDWGSAAYQGTTRVLTASGKVTLEGDPSKGKLSAKVEGDASLFKTDHHGQYNSPTVMVGGTEVATTDASANATVLVGVSGSAGAGVNWNSTDFGLNGEANVFAGAEAKGDVNLENRVLGVQNAAGAEGNARAGAEASAEGSIGAKGVKAEAGVFAGAKAGGEVKSSFAGIGVGVEGEAWAGAGAEGEFTAKMDDGKFKMKVAAGAAELVGAKGGFSIEVDPSEVAKLAGLPGAVEGLVDSIRANQEAQAFAARAQAEAHALAAQAQAEYARAQAEVARAQAQAHDQVLAQIENFRALTNNVGTQASNFASNAGSQISNFASNAGSGFSNFGRGLVSLFG